MKCQVADLPEGKKKLSIQVSAAELEAESDAILKELAKDAVLPGFRKGKVPVDHLKSQLGQEKVRTDALNNALPKYLTLAIQEEKLDAIGVTDLKVTSGQTDGPLEFEATVELRPELEIKDYKNLAIKIPPVQPTKEEIAEIQKSYLKSFGKLEDVGRQSMKGDHITIDLHSTYNGEEVQGMNVSDFVYELGTPSPITEMENELLAKKPGDILEFNSRHPTEDGNMRVKVLVKKIQENKTPELTEDLVKEISEFETVKELEEDMLVQIKESKRNNVWQVLQGKALEELEKLVNQPLPEALINNEIRTIEQQMPEGANLESIKDQIREQAISSSKIDLGLRSIIKQEKIEVSPAQLENEVEKVRQQIAKMPKDSSGADLQPSIENISVALLRQNALNWLIKHAHIEDDNNLEVDVNDVMPEGMDAQEPVDKENTKESTSPNMDENKADKGLNKEKESEDAK